MTARRGAEPGVGNTPRGNRQPWQGLVGMGFDKSAVQYKIVLVTVLPQGLIGRYRVLEITRSQAETGSNGGCNLGVQPKSGAQTEAISVF